MAKCFLPGRTYEVVKYLEKNCFFFKDLLQISELFVPLLAHVTRLCGLECHDYAITPHCYKVLWTMPKQQPFRRAKQKIRSKQAKRREVRKKQSSLRKKKGSNKGRRRKSPRIEQQGKKARPLNKKRKAIIRGGIPKAMELLNSYLNQYVGIIRGLSGPIFKTNYKNNYDSKLITSETDALRAHLEFKTLAQAEGYSASNERFGEAILRTERIGDTTEVPLVRPSCLGNRAKIGHNLKISFPLMPLLQNLSAEEVQKQVSELVQVARDLIEDQKEAEDRQGYLEEDIAQLPEPATPRPAYELEEDHRPRIDFDGIGAFSESIQQSILIERDEAAQAEEAFQDAYQSALRLWRLGNYEVPFPLGTYKLRVFHNCQIRGSPSLE